MITKWQNSSSDTPRREVRRREPFRASLLSMCGRLYYSENDCIIILPCRLGIRTVCRAGLFLVCEGTLAFLRPHTAEGVLGSSSEEGSILWLPISPDPQQTGSSWILRDSPCNGSYLSLPPPRVKGWVQSPIMTTGFGRAVFSRMILKRGLHNPSQHDGAMKRTDFS